MSEEDKSHVVHHYSNKIPKNLLHHIQMIQTNKPRIPVRQISKEKGQQDGVLPDNTKSSDELNKGIPKQTPLKKPEEMPPGRPVTPSPQAYRAQVFAELENRAKTCIYVPHKCSLPRVPGFQYCMNHILQDPRAPYKQCSFVYTSNGKRCPNAAPKIEIVKHNSYCFEHSRHAQRIRSRTMGRWVPPVSLDTALAKLAHYVTPVSQDTQENPVTPGAERIKREVIRKEVTVKTDENGKIIPLDPMTEINIEAVEKSRSALLYASDSDSDEEPVLYGDVNQSLSFLGSDDECVDDSSIDPLKHAGIYTAEEANTIIREKLSRLQTLYVEQFRMLHQELKIKRMKLMSSIRREQETLCSVQDQPKETAREINLYKKLKAYKRYQRKSGLEAVLYERSLERRAKQMDGVPHRTHQTGPKCVFTDGGVKCIEKPMPCSKYCRKHILFDKRQILFKPCGVEIGGVICHEPITGLLEVDTCPLHYKVPEPRTYNIRKESSDSEHSEEEVPSQTESNTLDVPIEMQDNMNYDVKQDNIKQEVILDVSMDLDVAECDVVTMDCQEENISEETVESDEIPLS